MVSKRKQEESERGGGAAAAAAEYEELRAKRIKENNERMKKLGILELSKKLHKEKASSLAVKSKAASSPPSASPSSHPPPPSRRSSRLKDMTRVSYAEIRSRSPKEKEEKLMKIVIKEGTNPEVYTEEHEKLLGDCKAAWTLNVDGYDSDGQRIYDPYQGKSCHQCRQKTLGHRTNCSKCKLMQFCGDCLYMRYGENVLEVNEDPGWICPVCRGICNCSRCRKEKGWEPTGPIYRKVLQHGFPSVAHYLIRTRRGTNQEEPAGENNFQQPNSNPGHISDDSENEVEDNDERERDDASRGDRYEGDEEEYFTADDDT